MSSLTFARPVALWLLLLVPVLMLVSVLLGARRRGLPRAALPLRIAVVALLSVTLAEPLLTSGAGAVSTVFVVDRSLSLTEDTNEEVAGWVNDALNAGGSTDRASVVTFGANPVLAASPDQANQIGSGWEGQTGPAENGDYTNIESALALARALPLGGSRRICLITDGAENVGSALNQAGQAAADGTPIDVVLLPGVGDGDLRVDGATAPSAIWVGDTLNVLASVATGTGGEGRIELWIDGVLSWPQSATFPAGISSYTFQVPDLPAGFHSVEVRVSAATGSTATDHYPENNVLPLALVVRDQPKILLVAPAGSDPGRLKGALERQRSVVTVIQPEQVPTLLSELTAYDAFILDNVSAKNLTLAQMTGLQEAARSEGRGLIVVGGIDSYGPGFYAGTILEETMPVTVKVTDGKQRERIAILFIMDKSGSMSYDPLGGTSKIDMAKQAVLEATDSLAVGDQVGILVFNDKQEWVVQMTTIEGDQTRAQIAEAVAGISSDGGTEIYPALSIGFDAIRAVDADVRHVVLLSDGKSRTGTRESYQKLIDDMKGDRTTLSAIAIGDDADVELLQFLAENGGGRYHFTNKPEDIPKLTKDEAQSAGSQSVIRGNFQPIQSQPSPILTGFDPEELPPLDGYDFAEPKPDVQIVLSSDRGDPVLAKWQYGLGRVVAWTADDGTDFAADWPSWQRYDEFWASMVRWVLPDPENRPIQVGVERDGPTAIVTVDAVGQQGDFVDLAATTATITTPSGEVFEDRPLYQTGPGQYQIRVGAAESGAYRVDLRQEREGGAIEEMAGFAVPPSPELQPSPDAPALLQALAARTGGRVLTLDEAAEVFDGGGLQGTALKDYEPIWYVPLALALTAFLAELAVRFRFLPRFGRRFA